MVYREGLKNVLGGAAACCALVAHAHTRTYPTLQNLLLSYLLGVSPHGFESHRRYQAGVNNAHVGRAGTACRGGRSHAPFKLLLAVERFNRARGLLGLLSEVCLCVFVEAIVLGLLLWLRKGERETKGSVLGLGCGRGSVRRSGWLEVKRPLRASVALLSNKRPQMC